MIVGTSENVRTAHFAHIKFSEVTLSFYLIDIDVDTLD